MGLAEFVICIPVFFLLVLAGIQFALWSHASHLARSASEEGSEVASGYLSSSSAGTEAATHFIATAGAGTLIDPDVTSTILPGDVVQVRVTGRAQALLPWCDLTVGSVSQSPVQEYRTGG